MWGRPWSLSVEMNSKILIAGAAAAYLISGAALAQMTPAPASDQPAMTPETPNASAPAGKPTMAPHHMTPHHMAKDKTSKYAAPSAPIPYSDLSNYPSEEKTKPMSMKHKAMKPKTPDTPAPAAS
jgi:hypothetical protein